MTRVKTQDPVVFVTIDDGFRIDPRVANQLREWNWPITSFVISSPLRANYVWFAELGRGSNFGNHTRSHTFLQGKSYEEQKKAICDGAADVERVTGSRPVWLRPPHGAQDSTTFRAAAACGMLGIVHWHVDVSGTKISTVARLPIRSGDIILLHYRPNLSISLEVLKKELDRLGLRPAPLDKYLPGPKPIVLPSAGCPTHYLVSCPARASS